MYAKYICIYVYIIFYILYIIIIVYYYYYFIKVNMICIITGKPLSLPGPTSTTSPKIKKHCVLWDKMHMSMIMAFILATCALNVTTSTSSSSSAASSTLNPKMP